MLFASSFHMPHGQRDDCEATWTRTLEELHASTLRLRHQDPSNFPTNVMARHSQLWPGCCSTLPGKSFSPDKEHGGISRAPDRWVLSFKGARGAVTWPRVLRSTWVCLIGADHAVVHATVRTTRITKMPRHRHFTKCGKWAVNVTKLLEECIACPKPGKQELDGCMCCMC